MAKKRRYMISAAVLAACVGAVVGVLAMLPSSGVTKENFDRIEGGMTLAAGMPAQIHAPKMRWNSSAPSFIVARFVELQLKQCTRASMLTCGS